MAKNWSSSSLAVIGNRVRLPRPPPLRCTTPSPLFASSVFAFLFLQLLARISPHLSPHQVLIYHLLLTDFFEGILCAERNHLFFLGFFGEPWFCFFCWFWGLLLLFHLLGCVLTEAPDFEALSLGFCYRSRSLEEVGVVVVLFLKALPMCRAA